MPIKAADIEFNSVQRTKMTKVDYKTLRTEDLISLAEKISDALPIYEDNKPLDVNEAYEMVVGEINRIHEKENSSDKKEDLFLTADQLLNNLRRRYDEGWGIIEKEKEVSQERKENCSERYFIDLMVDDNFFWGDCESAKGDYSFFSYRRDDDKKGVPDEQLLRDRSFEWLAKYMKSSVYRKDDSNEIESNEEDYDEGFPKDSSTS